MGKNIVVCCDGTGNEYGTNNTNVVEMYEPVIRDKNQIAYYDPGIGTFSIFGRALGKSMGIMMGQAFGYGLTENIEDAYTYLMDRIMSAATRYFCSVSAAARLRSAPWRGCCIRSACCKKGATI